MEVLRLRLAGNNIGAAADEKAAVRRSLLELE